MRGWAIVAAGAVTGGIILAAWMPFSALLSQRADVAATASQLARLTSQTHELAAEATRLSTPAAEAQLAREEYQLVEPGQRLIQVLTPSGTPSARSTDGPYPGDPGFSAPVSPGASALLTTGSGSSPATASRASAVARATGGYISRVLGTLEFWK